MEIFMDWKAFFKRVFIIGGLLTPINLYFVFISISPISHDAAFLKGVILLVGIFLLAVVSIFRFVYLRAEKFKIIQALATIFISVIGGYLFLFTGILILLVIGSLISTMN